MCGITYVPSLTCYSVASLSVRSSGRCNMDRYVAQEQSVSFPHTFLNIPLWPLSRCLVASRSVGASTRTHCLRSTYPPVVSRRSTTVPYQPWCCGLIRQLRERQLIAEVLVLPLSQLLLQRVHTPDDRLYSQYDIDRIY